MENNIYTVAEWSHEKKCWKKVFGMATNEIVLAMKDALETSKLLPKMVLKNGEPTGIAFYKGRVLEH